MSFPSSKSRVYRKDPLLGFEYAAAKRKKKFHTTLSNAMHAFISSEISPDHISRNRLLANITLGFTILMAIGPAFWGVFLGFGITSELDPLPIPLYLEPAGYAFVIWAFIYVGFLATGIYQALDSNLNVTRFIRARPYIILNACSNFLWFGGVASNQLWITVLCMLGMLISLIQLSILFELGKGGQDMREKLYLKLPLSLYFGWITMATPVNTTSFLIGEVGWTGEGIGGAELWSILLLGAAFFIVTALFRSKKVNGAYLGVAFWAFIAIFIANLDRSLMVGSGAAIFAGLVMIIFLWFRQRRPDLYPVL